MLKLAKSYAYFFLNNKYKYPAVFFRKFEVRSVSIPLALFSALLILAFSAPIKNA
jgi:hypothetical protein